MSPAAVLFPYGLSKDPGHSGKRFLDVYKRQEKQKLKVKDLLLKFEEANGEESVSDRMILA